MAITINASTTSGLVQTADNTGILQLQSNGTTVATFNASGVNAGIQVAANAAPAFSAYTSSNQTGLSNSTWTKVTLNAKEYDTNSNYDNTTNYRFTPTVAGYYLVTGSVAISGSSNVGNCVIYKNGNAFKTGNQNPLSSNYNCFVCSALVYLNGSTDYIELYGLNVSSTSIGGGSTACYFQASMVRSA